MANVIRTAALDIDGPVPRLFPRILWRIGWTVLTILLTQGFVCGAALFPVVLIWWQLLAVTAPSPVLSVLALNVFAVPSYVLWPCS